MASRALHSRTLRPCLVVEHRRTGILGKEIKWVRVQQKFNKMEKIPHHLYCIYFRRKSSFRNNSANKTARFRLINENSHKLHAWLPLNFDSLNKLHKTPQNKRNFKHFYLISSWTFLDKNKHICRLRILFLRI
jgi:hypothetical protein